MFINIKNNNYIYINKSYTYRALTALFLEMKLPNTVCINGYRDSAVSDVKKEGIFIREQDIQSLIRIAVSKDHCRIFRGNVGKVKTIEGRWFDTGLPPGYPDLHGYKISNGKMFYIEVKTPTGRPRADQIQFHNQLMTDHIIHGIARSPEDALKIIDEELVGYGFKS